MDIPGGWDMLESYLVMLFAYDVFQIRAFNPLDSVTLAEVILFFLIGNGP